MRSSSRIWVHVGLLGIAAGLAWQMSGRTDDTSNSTAQTTNLWKVALESIRSVSFDSGDHKVFVERRNDKIGDYAIVTSETTNAPEAVDAGVSIALKPEVKRYISVDAASKMLEGLAGFKITRTLGKLDKARFAEFGLDKPTGTLKIDFASGPRTIVVGASTPGGGNYYVRDEQSGVVQIAAGDPISTLQYADARMSERDLHGWKTDEPVRIAIQAGGKRRQLVKVTGKSNAWADASTPASQDETASNWVTKLAQFHVSGYFEKFQSTPTPILRVEYGDPKSDLGYIELFRVNEGSDAPKYVVRTERSRWFAEVVKSQAEQIEKDVALVAR